MARELSRTNKNPKVGKAISFAVWAFIFSGSTFFYFHTLGNSNDDFKSFMGKIVASFMTLLTFFVCAYNYQTLRYSKRVVEDGEDLLISDDYETIKINKADIAEVFEQRHRSSRRIFLKFNHATKFGKEIHFNPLESTASSDCQLSKNFNLKIFMHIPTIETDRLKLRAHRPSDFSALKVLWSDPKVVKHISGIPSTEQQSWMRLLTYMGHWQAMGFGYWAIEEKTSGSYIGDIGFADFKREITPSISGTPESGWVLASSVHGKGYATEALKAILEWGDANLEVSKSVCIITPENVQSIKLAKKVGYLEVGETMFNEKKVILFSRERAY